MKNAGLGSNVIKPSRDFLVDRGLITATPEDSKGEFWTFEILDPQTFQPFTNEYGTGNLGEVKAGETIFTMADQFGDEDWSRDATGPEPETKDKPALKRERTAQE